MTWHLKQAEAQFTHLLDAASNEGAQVVTREGEEVAVLVSVDHWKRLLRGSVTLADRNVLKQSGPTLKDVLLGPGPRWDDMMIPERHPSEADPSNS